MTQTNITSPSNQRLKQLRKLARARERAQTGLFAAEGEDLVRAAHAAGREALYGFRAPSAELDMPGFEQIAPELLAGVSTLGSGSRAIGVYEQRFEQPKGPLCVYLHGVGDPGNVGAILRSALAFGAGSVALGPGCADPHSPKAVRASMGAIFAVPLARAANLGELPGEQVALVAHAGEPLASLRPTGQVTLLVGAEREGLPDDLVAGCDRVAHIPIAGDSLNAAMAATVALYELSRLTDRGARRSRETRASDRSGETLASGSHPPSDPPSGQHPHFGQLGLRPAAPPSRVPRS